MGSRRGLLPTLALLVLGAAILGGLFSRSNDEPATQDDAISASQADGKPLLEVPDAGTAHTIPQAAPQAVLAAKVSGLIVRSVGDADGPCRIVLTSSSGDSLAALALERGPFELMWQWEPGTLCTIASANSRPVRVEITQPQQDLGEVRLEVARTYGGVVQGPGEVPLAGAVVSLVGDETVEVAGSASTDELGRFSLPLYRLRIPPAGDAKGSIQGWHVVVRWDAAEVARTASVPAQIDGLVGSHTVLVAAAETGFLVRLVDSKGRPEPGVRVRLQKSVDLRRPFTAARPFRAVTNERGECRLLWPRGLYTLAIHCARDEGDASWTILSRRDAAPGSEVVLRRQRPERALEIFVGPQAALAGYRCELLLRAQGHPQSDGPEGPVAPLIIFARVSDAQPQCRIRLLESPSFVLGDQRVPIEWEASLVPDNGGAERYALGTTVLELASGGVHRGRIEIDPELEQTSGEDLLWLRLARGASIAAINVRSVGLVAHSSERDSRAWFGKPAWWARSNSAHAGALFPIQGIPSPRRLNLTAFSADSIELVLRDDDGRIWTAPTTLAAWSHAAERERPLDVSLRTRGASMQVRVVAEPRVVVAGAEVRISSLSAGGDMSNFAYQATRVPASGEVYANRPEAGKSVSVLARASDGSMGLLTLPPGVNEGILRLRPAKTLRVSIELEGGATPTYVRGYLSTVARSDITVPLLWNRELKVLESATPVVPEMFEANLTADSVLEPSDGRGGGRAVRYTLRLRADAVWPGVPVLLRVPR